MTDFISSGSIALLALFALATGAAIQVAAGAGLSVICSPTLLLILPARSAIPLLILANLMVALVGTVHSFRTVDWAQVRNVVLFLLIGCALASFLPPLPDHILKLIAAGTLLYIATRRPHAPGTENKSRAFGLAAAAILTGALTVLTAIPGPIIPAALARAGYSGLAIARIMQPLSLFAFGSALFIAGPPSRSIIGVWPLACGMAATFLGIFIGFWLRKTIDARCITYLIRAVAVISALLLLWSASV